jgi:hypothetical protein
MSGIECTLMRQRDCVGETGSNSSHRSWGTLWPSVLDRKSMPLSLDLVVF